MAMGRKTQRQDALWIVASDLPKSPGHPFYRRLNILLEARGFDRFVEQLCARFYADGVGRPSLPPGRYFRLLLLGYFEGLDSERGIAWRASDSLAIRGFLGLGLDEAAPDHSTISRTRRLIDVEAHREVFTWVQAILAGKKLLRGKTVGIDATTLEANAAMRSIVRRDTGEKYDKFLARLASESGIRTPTRAALARLDRRRRNKTSNKDWQSPSDPDAKVTKMKDGRTHLAHKAEHAVDLESGALIAVTIHGADEGDTATIAETLAETEKQLDAVIESAPDDVDLDAPAEVVADKGYHSDATLLAIESCGSRSYISEPDRGRRKWRDNPEAQIAVYSNRRRIRGRRGRQLLRKRGERIERSFAHLYDTGGMRRTHVRGHDNIRKRVLIHASAFNLSLLFRELIGRGTPRGLQGLFALISVLTCGLRGALEAAAELLAFRNGLTSPHSAPLLRGPVTA